MAKQIKTKPKPVAKPAGDPISGGKKPPIPPYKPTIEEFQI